MDKRFISFNQKLAGANDDARTIDFVISTDDPDRVGDRVNPNGWDLTNYKSNPVVLWGHESWSFPIGKASNLRVEGNALKATAQFATADEYPMADTVYKLLKGGFLSAVSVGFRPIEWRFTDYGVDFSKQELLEFSVVSIPANPYALSEARAKGIATQAMADGLRKMHGAAGSQIDRARVEAAFLAATGQQSMVPAPIQVRDTANFRRKSEVHARQLRLLA